MTMSVLMQYAVDLYLYNCRSWHRGQQDST